MPIQLSGSLVITGSITTTGVITMSGSIASASYSSTSDLLQGTGSVGFTTTASFNAVSSSQQQISASYIALSASYNTFSGSASTRITVDSASLLQVSASQQQISASYIALSGSYNTFSGSASTRVTQIETVYATTGSNSFRATQSITGSLTVTGQIIAQTLNVQQVTSSIIYSSGSNNFGCDLNSRQTFTGSVLITGSLTIAGASSATSYNAPTIFGSTIACSPIGCFATSCATSFIGGTMSGTTIYGSTAVCSPIGLFSGCIGIGASINPTYMLEVSSTGGSQRIRVGTLQNNDNTPRFEAITSNGTLVANSAWLKVNDAGGFTLGQSDYTKAGGDSGNFACLSSETEYPRITVTSGGNVGIGVASPNSILHIEAGNNTTNQFRVNSCDGLNAGVRSYTTSDCAGLIINHYYAVSGNPYLRTSDFVSNQGDAASTQMRFFTKDYSANAALALIITSGRYVGIGTTSPSSKLTIIRDSPYNTGDQGLRIRACDSDGYNLWMGASVNGYATIQSYQDNVGGAPLLLNPLNGGYVGIGTCCPTKLLDMVGDTYAGIGIYDGTNTAVMQWHASDGFRIVTATAKPIVFFTNNTERMRLTSGGTLSINSTRTSSKLVVDSDLNVTTGIEIKDTGTTGGAYIYFVNSAGNQSGIITHSGTTAVTYTTTSDYRLKENVKTIENGLNKVLSLKPVTYTWINTNNEQGEGFLAHELQEIVPLAVVGQKDELKEDGSIKSQSIDNSRIVPILVKAIQEQQCTICSQASRITLLESCLGIA